jgi:hypothetical protein
MRKLAKLTSILFVSVFIGMQFVPPPAISKTPKDSDSRNTHG